MASSTTRKRFSRKGPGSFMLRDSTPPAFSTFMELAIGDLFALVRIVAFPYDGNLIAPFGKMAINTIRRHVQGAIFEPANINGTRIEGGVLDFGDDSKRLPCSPQNPAGSETDCSYIVLYDDELM